MAPIDPSIPLSVRPFRPPDFAAARQRAMTLADLARQNRAGQREEQDALEKRRQAQAIDQALRRHTKPDGTTDTDGLLRELRQTVPQVAREYAADLKKQAHEERKQAAEERKWQREETEPIELSPGASLVDPQTYEPRYTAPRSPAADIAEQRAEETERHNRALEGASVRAADRAAAAAERAAYSADPLTPSARRAYNLRKDRLRRGTEATIKAGKTTKYTRSFLGVPAGSTTETRPWRSAEADSIRGAEEEALSAYEASMTPRAGAAAPSRRQQEQITSPATLRAYARKYGLTDAQARSVLAAHGIRVR